MSSKKRISGSKLKALRASAGWSASMLSAYIDSMIENGADLTPVPTSTIQSIEKGLVSDSSYLTVKSIAVALEADPDSLYEESPVEKKPRGRVASRPKPKPAKAARNPGSDS